MADTPTPVRLQFGSFLADFRACELRKNGRRIRMQEKPMLLLEALASKPGEVISREDLQKLLWPGDTFVDFEIGLNAAVRKLREALADSPENPKYIETIPKRGYRFIGIVQEPANTLRAPVGPTARVAVDSIVVLPFTSMSADPADEFFADGMTEEIINALAQVDQLHVVARTSAFSFKGKYIDVRSVGKQLNVRTVLLGSVRRADNELRITAQLVNAEEGYHLWSDRFDREVKDIFEIQDEIARSIVERLKVTLKAGDQERLVTAGTNTLESYQLYVKGRELLYRRGGVISRAAECFEREVSLDPDYALAWAGLADSQTVLGYYGFARPEANTPKALEAAHRAVMLGPSLAEARNALAMASLMCAWDGPTAEQEFHHAIELNPSYTQARDWYALFYLQFSEGRLAEGVEQAKLALKADPLSSYAHAVYGLTCGNAGKKMEAVQACQRAVELDSESFVAQMLLQLVLHIDGKLEESVAAGESALAMSGRLAWSMAFLAVTYGKWGRIEQADALYSEMLARARRQYVPAAQLALAAAAASRESDALRHATEAFAVRDPDCQFFFSRHLPFTAPLYAYPRFHELLVRNGRSNWLCCAI